MERRGVNVKSGARRQQQALPRDDAMESLSVRNRLLQERVESLEEQISKDVSSRPSVGGALNTH